MFVFPGAGSIGGFGIREAAFVVILGLFGVGRENALASSFISLASVLITVGAGGLIWLNGGLTFCRERREHWKTNSQTGIDSLLSSMRPWA